MHEQDTQERSLVPKAPAALDPESFRACLRKIQRRQWWLWSSAVAVTLLLTSCIASFAFPGLIAQVDELTPFDVSIPIRGLVGLVLLFNVYAIYQQLQLHRIHYHLGDQLAAMDRMEQRTQEVYKLAVLDPLTGLHNRRAGEHRLAEEVSRAQRHGHPLTILMLDLDGLKGINDRFGHAAGDHLLQSFAEHLSRGTRGSDVAVRLGGDEFLVVLPECENDKVERILHRLENLETQWENHRVPISFSSSWTSYQPGEPSEEFLKRADQALYANKRAPRKRPAPEPVAAR
jgi:diguanylate cyclase (GGDEF)-like protein